MNTLYNNKAVLDFHGRWFHILDARKIKIASIKLKSK